MINNQILSLLSSSKVKLLDISVDYQKVETSSGYSTTLTFYYNGIANLTNFLILFIADYPTANKSSERLFVAYLKQGNTKKIFEASKNSGDEGWEEAVNDSTRNFFVTTLSSNYLRIEPSQNAYWQVFSGDKSDYLAFSW